jgi:hypothetical protein
VQRRQHVTLAYLLDAEQASGLELGQGCARLRIARRHPLGQPKLGGDESWPAFADGLSEHQQYAAEGEAPELARVKVL